MVAREGALGHMAAPWPLEGLQTKVSHTNGQPYLHDQAPIKTWHQGLGEQLGCNIPSMLSHFVAGRSKHCLHDATKRGQQEVL